MMLKVGQKELGGLCETLWIEREPFGRTLAEPERCTCTRFSSTFLYICRDDRGAILIESVNSYLFSETYLFSFTFLEFFKLFLTVFVVLEKD